MLVEFTKEGISQVPRNRPVVYTILNGFGTRVYIGSSMRGEVQNRLLSHLRSRKIKTGSRVRIRQYASIAEARAAEMRLIAIHRPIYNRIGK